MNQKKDIPLRSLADSCVRLAKVSAGKIVDDDPRYIMACPPDSGFYSRYVLFEEAKDSFTEILEHIKVQAAHGAPAMLSFNCSMPAGDYESVLAAHGFVKMVDQTGMVCTGLLEQKYQSGPDRSGVPQQRCQNEMERSGILTLEDPVSNRKWNANNETAAATSPADSKAETVTSKDFVIKRLDKKELFTWCACIQQGFGPFKVREDEAFIKLLEDAQVAYYGAYVDGVMVGGSMLIMDPAYAGIHEVATLEAFRGRGICSALVRKMCLDLQEAGIQEVSLQASPFGQPVYTKAGFEPVDIVTTWVMHP